jgi:hypothetical protein
VSPDNKKEHSRHGFGHAGAGPFQRLLFAVIGLAGNLALLIFLLCNALRLRAALLKGSLIARAAAEG